jgi:hypothetical protein
MLEGDECAPYGCQWRSRAQLQPLQGSCGSAVDCMGTVFLDRWPYAERLKPEIPVELKFTHEQDIGSTDGQRFSAHDEI